MLALLAIRIVQGLDVATHDENINWGISDWMISYADGFVRRGFGGALLAGLMRLTGIGFFPLLVTITTTAYLLVCAWLLRITWRLRGPALWRFVLLFCPILVISLCDFGTVCRKDVLFLLGTMLTVGLSERALRNTDHKRLSRCVVLLLLTFGLMAIELALLHEGLFTFIWLPMNAVILAYVLHRSGRSNRTTVLLLVATLVPALVAVAASTHWHGNGRTAQAVCRSWQSASPAPCRSLSNSPALGALAWNLPHELSRSLFSAEWLPIFILVFVLGGTLELLAVRALIPSARLEHLIALLALPFAASLPLYLLGIDWGRWTSLIATSSLLVMLNPTLRPCCFEALPSFLRNLILGHIVPALDRLLGRWQSKLQQEALFVGFLLLIVPVPFLPDRRMIFSPMFVLLKFLTHVIR
ncbi:MAG: hypothetical protein ACLGXA_21880 [Acidobacteriota bacterium]